MNKSTIELIRIKDHVRGYELFHPPKEIFESSQLDTIVNWSKNNLTKEQKVYKHILRRLEEGDDSRVYKYFIFGREVSKEQYNKRKGKLGTYPCYYCDLVYYLDIYWQ